MLAEKYAKWSRFWESAGWFSSGISGTTGGASRLEQEKRAGGFSGYWERYMIIRVDRSRSCDNFIAGSSPFIT